MYSKENNGKLMITSEIYLCEYIIKMKFSSVYQQTIYGCCKYFCLILSSLTIYCFQVQGKSESAAEKLKADAIAVENAGASLLLLECVPEGLAQLISKSISIPTIGIGAGIHCDGQGLIVSF